jgi:hypothetical protein
MNRRWQEPLLVALPALAVGLAMAVLWAVAARRLNGGPGFPLDDPWIHLQFARNLRETGAFSYFRDQMSTSGSTSPLYTGVLALGFLFTRNEFGLSYVLGVLFLLVGAGFLSRLAAGQETTAGHPPDRLWAVAAPLLMVLDPRLVWAALSGMETTLFIALLLGAMLCYRTRRPIGLGVSAGLLLWARPEAVLFFAALLLDAGYHAWLARKSPGSNEGASLAWLKKPSLIALGICATYLGFNYRLSGSLLPNTFAAKLKYYAQGSDEAFRIQVFHFLLDDHMLPVALLAAAGVAAVLLQVARRRPAPALLHLLWAAALYLAYMRKLPYLYQNGRYLMPLLPSLILLAAAGLRGALELAATADTSGRAPELLRRVRLPVIALAVVFFAVGAWTRQEDYAGACRYIGDRQVRTARWLRDHLPANAVVATHDVGAIAYYSNRRVVDMVGLVSPKMIATIGQPDRVRERLIHEGVTHLAVLRNWFRLVNQRPLFQTDPTTPEIMEVFAFDRALTHLTPPVAAHLSSQALEALNAGDALAAQHLLQRAIGIDPTSAVTHHMLAQAFLMDGNLNQATHEVEVALRIEPTSPQAALVRAKIAAARKLPLEAIKQLEALVEREPRFAPAYQGLADLYRARKEPARAAEYQRLYDQLAGAPHE